MNESYDILVIILAVALGIFLVLGIILLIIAIKVTKQVGEMTNKAQGVVHNVENVSKVFSKAAGPMALGKIVSNVVDMYKNSKSSKGK